MAARQRQGWRRGQNIRSDRRSSPRSYWIEPQVEKGTKRMPRVQDTDEVRILRYFEEEPLEKVELLFPIIGREDAQAHATGEIFAQKEGCASPSERKEGRRGRCSLDPAHKKDLHDLVRTAALTATRSFHYKTVRCISIKAGDARQGGGTHLLVTDPGEPGSRTGGDARRLIKVPRLDARRKYAPRRIPYRAGCPLR